MLSLLIPMYFFASALQEYTTNLKYLGKTKSNLLDYIKFSFLCNMYASALCYVT